MSPDIEAVPLERNAHMKCIILTYASQQDHDETRMPTYSRSQNPPPRYPSQMRGAGK
jgi:hypothetical protein